MTPALILFAVAGIALFYLATAWAAAPYIPSKTVQCKDWAVNFAATITANPAAYGLTSGDAAVIQAAADQFADDFALYGSVNNVAVNPTTRTQAGVFQLANSKQAFIGIARPYAQQIRINPGITDPNKIALGLNLPNNTPTPVPAPVTFPVLSFVGATPLQHTLRFADSATPTQLGRKPQGVTGMQLFRTLTAISDPVPTDPDAALLVDIYTRVPIGPQYSSGQAGKRATYWARWMTKAQAPGGSGAQVGPWSASISAIVQPA